MDERFWDFVNKDGPIPEHVPTIGKCWLWTGGKGSNGYGYFYSKGKEYRAHRYMMGNPKVFVLHKCDNPPCVNPDHLWLGTQKDNMRDAKQKGRMAKYQPKKRLLNSSQVMEIRSRYPKDSVRKLAAEFGIGSTSIFGIVTRRYYRDI